jgi:hypothetical protein
VPHCEMVLGHGDQMQRLVFAIGEVNNRKPSLFHFVTEFEAFAIVSPVLACAHFPDVLHHNLDRRQYNRGQNVDRYSLIPDFFEFHRMRPWSGSILKVRVLTFFSETLSIGIPTWSRTGTLTSSGKVDMCFSSIAERGRGASPVGGMERDCSLEAWYCSSGDGAELNVSGAAGLRLRWRERRLFKVPNALPMASVLKRRGFFSVCNAIAVLSGAGSMGLRSTRGLPLLESRPVVRRRALAARLGVVPSIVLGIVEE